MGKCAGVGLELWETNKRKEKLFKQKRHYLSRKVEPYDPHLLIKQAVRCDVLTSFKNKQSYWDISDKLSVTEEFCLRV